MIARLIALLRKPQPEPPPVVDMADLIIATRALRVHNRSDKGASTYRAVHSILKQGVRKC